MTTSPTDPNQSSKPSNELFFRELLALKQEVAELRYDLKKEMTLKISTGVSRGINNAFLPWLPLIFLYLLIGNPF